MSKEKKVDLLMIRFPDNCKEEWANQALQSIKNEPINLTILPGIHEGPLTQRLEFIKKVQAPYFCWIDDDDQLIEGTVQICIDELEKEENINKCGVFTNHYNMNEDGVIIETPEKYQPRLYSQLNKSHRPFHFLLWKKEVIPYILKYYESIPDKGDLYSLSTLATYFGEWKFIKHYGYKWRNRENSYGKNIENFNGLMDFCTKHLQEIRKLKMRT